MADFYRVTPPAHDHLYSDQPSADASADASPTAVRISEHSKAHRSSVFEGTKFSAHGITTATGGAIVGRDIRDSDLITVDGMQMTIGSARHLGLINPDRT